MEQKILLILFLLLICSTTCSFAREGKKVSLSFRKIPLQDALRLIAKQAGLNLIVARGVRGEVSVDLKDVNSIDALNILARGNGYVFEKRGNVFVCSKRATKKKVSTITVIRLRNSSSENVARILNHFKKQSGVNASFDKRSNSIILVQSGE
ncbi:hypothetical protein ACFL35_09860 [Candidatus Riflebacteria bacterium]